MKGSIIWCSSRWGLWRDVEKDFISERSVATLHSCWRCTDWNNLPSVWLFGNPAVLHASKALLSPREVHRSWHFFIRRWQSVEAGVLVWILMTVSARRKCNGLTTAEDACERVADESWKADGFSCHNECYISPFTAVMASVGICSIGKGIEPQLSIAKLNLGCGQTYNEMSWVQTKP